MGHENCLELAWVFHGNPTESSWTLHGNAVGNRLEAVKYGFNKSVFSEFDFVHEMGCHGPDSDDKPALKSPTLGPHFGKVSAAREAKKHPKMAKKRSH